MKWNKFVYQTAMTGFLSIASSLLLGSLVVEGKETVARNDVKAFLQAMHERKFGSDESFFQRLIIKAEPMKKGRKLADEDAEAEEEGDDDAEEQFQYDISDYSLKYAGCQSVLTWSDEQAEDEESEGVVAQKRYVLFRLCPSDSCNKYSVTGCTGDYGEYLILLDDYIETVSEYQEAKRQSICNYCAGCDENENNDGRKLNDARILNDAEDENAEEKEEDVQDDENVCDAEICSNYSEKCNNDDDNAQIDVRDFAGCAAVEDDNGNEYFLAPHCNSDGFSVSIQVFSDDACTQHIQDGITAYDLTGFDIDAAGFSDYFPRDCTSCLAEDNLYGNQEAGEDDNIYQMCEDLFESAAKCNKNYEDENLQLYENENEAAQEDLVCDYIDSLRSGSYNEDGEINLDAGSWWFFNISNWNDKSEYLGQLNHMKSMSEKTMKPWQIFALIVTSVGCVCMWIWACCIHSALKRRNIPWKPRRSKDTLPGDISRQNSGIVLGRSSSGQKSTPLI